MASVPNLPIAPAVPVPGAPGAAGEGAALDIFAQLLSGGPAMAVVAGPGVEPPEEVSLRAAPADGQTDREVEGDAGEPAPDGAAPADIIPLLQAQSGFPVAVTPTAQAGAPAPVAAQPVAGAPGKPARAVPSAIEATPDAKIVQPESEPPADPLVDAAVKAAVGKIVGKPSGRAAKADRPDAPAESKPVAPSMQPERPRQPETAGVRFEAVVQPAASTAGATQTTAVAPAFSATTVATQPAAPAAPAAAAPEIAELVVERQLDLAGDDQWLDRLARDIARTGAGGEPLRFRLHPQTLGALQVELSQSDRGATVRLTVETEAARNILVDAQPRLAAEARAQGVRLAGTEVDLAGAGQQQDDARRNAEARPQDVVRVVRAAQSSSTPSEPATGRSDRYA